ncbi:MAG: ion transporter [Salinarimonas sp.]|nr:ion transporter [Salinarimonas sp.]
MTSSRIRQALASALDPDLGTVDGLSWLNRAIVGIIVLSLLLVILETEPLVYAAHERLFTLLELMILTIFMGEYAARLWVCVENPRFSSRLAYARRPMAVLDLVVIVTMAVSLVGFEGALLRLLRLARLLRVAKLGRFAEAFRTIGEAVGARRYELLVSLAVAGGLLLVSASALYLIEGGRQQEAFGSIPRAMWWSVATLTTVGYGDVVPATPLGKVFATLTAITGVGLIAMPAGILASAFSDAMQRKREKDREEDRDGV